MKLGVRRLRLLAILQVLALSALFEALRRMMGSSLFTWQGSLIAGAATFLCGTLLVSVMFRVIKAMQSRVELQNREILALDDAARNIYRELDLETVLQRMADRSRSLVGARYGAISVLDRDRIATFVTSGISAEERARIGAPPQGKGLLSVSLRAGQSLRLNDIASDPRAVGFPSHHPPMRSLVAVPIPCASPFKGNLYLAEPESGGEFSAGDEATLSRFATKAAVAIDYAYQHARLNELALAEERLRIAHEMHDGLAQVLASVNAKAQAVREHLRAGRGEEAARQLEQLASAAREVYKDVRQSITGLRAAAATDWHLAPTLTEYAVAWQAETGVECETEIDLDLKLSPAVEFQLLRIAQEALANVRKHADAHHVTIAFQSCAGEAILRIADDGVGLRTANDSRPGGPHFGLLTMGERGKSIGAQVRVGSQAHHGTEVVVAIPLRLTGAVADGQGES